MLLTATTATAAVKTVTYTYTDYRGYRDANDNIIQEAIFTATGDVNATYVVDITRLIGGQSVSFTLGDLHVNWASNENDYSAGNFGGWRIGGRTKLYSVSDRFLEMWVSKSY